MIGVAAPSVVPCFDNIVVIGVDVILVNVTAEDSLVDLPVTLITAGLRAVGWITLKWRERISLHKFTV